MEFSLRGLNRHTLAIGVWCHGVDPRLLLQNSPIGAGLVLHRRDRLGGMNHTRVSSVNRLDTVWDIESWPALLDLLGVEELVWDIVCIKTSHKLRSTHTLLKLVQI
ncbi:hypothetical protein HG530_001661 [Fusarium avenaceum]|nr:hypothetical protein HG530_001661 [Fusarium avenaceum]